MKPTIEPAHLLFYKKFIYLILVVLGLLTMQGLPLVVVSRDYALVVVHRLLIATASFVANHRL